MVDSSNSDLEGSPLDRLFALTLTLIAIVVLQNRDEDWRSFVARNKSMCLLYLYLGVSVLWSDFTYVAFKRWFKECGNLLVLLVLWSETNPINAIKAVFVRCAYLLLPLSIVLIKYYPAFGRQYSISGEQMVTGVTTQKNSLGEICVVLGLFLIWDLLDTLQEKGRTARKKDYLPYLAIILLAVYLLLMSNSKTALLCGIVGLCIVLSHKVRFVCDRRPLVVSLCLFCIPLISLAVTAFGLGASFAQTLGRESTLTGRTEIWRQVLSLHTNPLVGTGFYSFWLGARREAIWQQLSRINTAHNGYLEIYLDGGIIGLALLLVALLAASRHSGKAFISGAGFGRMAFAFLVMLILLNFSESTFFRLSAMWLSFLVTGLAFPTKSAESGTHLQH